jgi:hypothetical protein
VIVLVVLGGAVVVLWRRSRGLARRFEAITRGAAGDSLEAVLESHLRRVHGVARDVEQLAARAATLERDVARAQARVGLVRFNPFEDTGSNQSFALAVLDGHGDGYIVSSLHARQATRVYAKTITAGRAEAALSDEETEALRQALARPVAGGAR